MNQVDMLQGMCRVLGSGDLKAIVKARGLPAAATHPGIFAGLFLTEQGVAHALRQMEPPELAVLHLLKSFGEPVPISFFGRVYPARSRGTFTQRFQITLGMVKERLVRAGVLLMYETRGNGEQARMELWRFAFPLEFHSHLPPLLPFFHTFDGPGICRPDAARAKLCSDLRGEKDAKRDEALRFQIVDGELRLGGSLFRCDKIPQVQNALWAAHLKMKPLAPEKSAPEEYRVQPTVAVATILASLNQNEWVDAEQLGALAHVFAGTKVNCVEVCEAGWQVGSLAKHEAAGKDWFRLAPSEQALAPHQYLHELEGNGSVSLDLEIAPWQALETLALLSHVRLSPGNTPSLLFEPNLVRIGRASVELLAREEAAWLFRQVPAFTQAQATRTDRWGKTVLHDGVLVARVTDLSLKVALEKTLGDRLVTLKNDYVVFPRQALNEVTRVVKKSGHVIKEIVAP